jgi:hypothetical protein
MLLGFPGALNTTDYAAERVRPGPIAISLSWRSASTTSTKLEFDATTSQPMPHLDGVSGSGLWSVTVSRRAGEPARKLDRIELAGIVHTHKDAKLVASPLAPISDAARALVERAG